MGHLKSTNRYIIGIGLFAILMSLYQWQDSVTEDDLEKVELIVHNTPKLLMRKGRTWLDIETNNKKCHYEITGGAYRVLSESFDKMKIVKDIGAGEKIDVKVERNNRMYSRGLYCVIKVYGVSIAGQTIVKPKDVIEFEFGHTRLFIFIGLSLVLIGICLRIF